MSTVLKIMTLIAFLLAAPWAAAQSKIAVFDLQEAILSTNKARQQMKAFESRADIAKMISDAEQLRKELTDLRIELSDSKLPQAQQEEVRKQMDYKQADFELIVRKLNTERTETSKKMLTEIGPRLESIVKGIIEQDGIGLLLDKKAAIHAAPTFDITAKVTERLNAAVK